MSPEFQVARFLCYSGSLFFGAVSLILWCYALFRTRLWFLWLFVFSALMNVGFGLTTLVLLLDSQALVAALGHSGYIMFYNVLLSAQVIMDIVGTVGVAFMVVWLCRQAGKRPNTSLEPTPTAP